MSKCGNCCYGVMTGPNKMFCSAKNCFCEEVFGRECYEPIVKPTTNADKIKRAGNESEMASAFIDFLCIASCIGGMCETPDKACRQCVLDWLRQEAQDG